MRALAYREGLKNEEIMTHFRAKTTYSEFCPWRKRIRNSGEIGTFQTLRRSEVDALERRHTCHAQDSVVLREVLWGDMVADPFCDVFPAYK